MLVWLSIYSEVQMICICSNWCHCHSITSCFIRIQNILPFLCQLTQVWTGKKTVVTVWLLFCISIVSLMPWAVWKMTLCLPILHWQHSTSLGKLQLDVIDVEIFTSTPQVLIVPYVSRITSKVFPCSSQEICRDEYFVSSVTRILGSVHREWIFITFCNR